MKPIEAYTDYRKYLADYYSHAKNNRRYFSYRYFCDISGIKSPAFYRSVVKGERSLTAKTILAFICGLGLKKQEGEYFTALVYYTQAKHVSDKQKYLEKMRGSLPTLKEAIVPVDYYAYYSTWYNIVIRELACIFDWKGDYSLLAKKVCPAIKKSQARESIQLLLDLGFLKQDKKGAYHQVDRHVTTGSEVVSTAVRVVNKKMADLGKESIDQFSPSQRDVSSLTMGVSQKTYGLIKQEIQEFKNKLKQLIENEANEDPNELNSDCTVYNINVQLFPLSDKIQPAGGEDDQ